MAPPAAVPPVRPLLERCLVHHGGDDWAALLGRYADVLHRAFGAAHAPGLAYDQFADWFPGWLFSTRKLHALYRAFAARAAAGLFPDPAAEELYVRNHLVGAVRAAVGDWLRGQRPVPAHAPRAPSHAERAEAVARVREALAEIPRELRVPFWVRHVRALGPLPPADLDWLAGVGGQSPEAVARAIAREADGQDDPDCPLSSRFVGRMLRMPLSVGGKPAAVDQRVRRTRNLVREKLRPEG